MVLLHYGLTINIKGVKEIRKIEPDYVFRMVEDLCRVDLSLDTRKQNNTVCRDLLFYILNKRCGMNDRQIADYFEEKTGIARDRSSIYIAINRVPSHLGYFEWIKPAYEHFMEQIPVDVDYLVDKRLIDAIKDIPFHRVEEIVELISIRRKSWEWKSEDKYEIINCQV